MKCKFLLLPLGALVVHGGPAYGTVYLTLEQAQALLFPGATFQADARTLTDEQVKAIERVSGVSVRNRQLRAWRASTGARSSDSGRRPPATVTARTRSGCAKTGVMKEIAALPEKAVHCCKAWCTVASAAGR